MWEVLQIPYIYSGSILWIKTFMNIIKTVPESIFVGWDLIWNWRHELDWAYGCWRNLHEEDKFVITGYFSKNSLAKLICYNMVLLYQNSTHLAFFILVLISTSTPLQQYVKFMHTMSCISPFLYNQIDVSERNKLNLWLWWEQCHKRRGELLEQLKEIRRVLWYDLHKLHKHLHKKQWISELITALTLLIDWH